MMSIIKSLFCNHTKSLFQAILDSRNEQAACLLSETPSLADTYRNTPWLKGARPLHCCAYAGNTTIAEKLIAMGAEVDVRAGAGETPLYVAAIRSQPALVELLLAKGADLRKKTVSGQTLLHGVCKTGDVAMLATLIDRGCEVNEKDSGGLTPLHCAVANGRSDSVECLVRHGANIDAQGEKGVTPLLFAVDVGSEAMISLLLRLGANQSLCRRVPTKLGEMSLDAHAMSLLYQAKGSIVHGRILALLRAEK